MTNWYRIIPSGPITLGNLTPVGQNSGQVGCRWPPNGHQLAGCLNLPTDCQLWGPFWYNDPKLYVIVPQTLYTPHVDRDDGVIPETIYRLRWESHQWQPREEHRHQEIELVGGRYVINANDLRDFWSDGEWKNTDSYLFSLPWTTLTLSHNRRIDYQVAEEGGFFAEMTTLLHPEWSIAVKIIGDYTPPTWSILGAGGIPVRIEPLRRQWDWLGGEMTENSTGAILLTGALWQQGTEKQSVPYPPVALKSYAADLPIPWQSWKKVKRKSSQNSVKSLTPGEWLTPAGAVYLWENESPVSHSGPFCNPLAPYHRDALGYGHLWLFKD